MILKFSHFLSSVKIIHSYLYKGGKQFLQGEDEFAIEFEVKCLTLELYITFFFSLQPQVLRELIT